jgi:hypothetical protein
LHNVNIHSIIRRSIGSLEKTGLDEITDTLRMDSFLDKITDLSSFTRYFFKLIMRQLEEAEAEKGEQLKNFVFIIDEIMTIDEAHHNEKVLAVGLSALNKAIGR